MSPAHCLVQMGTPHMWHSGRRNKLMCVYYWYTTLTYSLNTTSVFRTTIRQMVHQHHLKNTHNFKLDIQTQKKTYKHTRIKLVNHRKDFGEKRNLHNYTNDIVFNCVRYSARSVSLSI